MAPAEPSLLIQGKKDRFGGVTVDLDASVHGKLSAVAFSDHLRIAIQRWQHEGKRGIWLRVPKAAAHLVGSAVEQGFDFHHATPGQVMLTKWLPIDVPSGLPAYPHHQIGVGGLVLDKTGERVLCIQERAGVTAGMKEFWKLPGGLVDHGEDICDAAVREIREETSVQTVFDCVAAIRETHSGPFGCTDLYAICILHLDEAAYDSGMSVPDPQPQEREIAAAEWRNLEEFLSSPYYAKGLYGSLLKTAAAVALRRRRAKDTVTSGRAGEVDSTEATLGFNRAQLMGLSRRPESMYFAGSQVVTETKARL